MTTFNPYSWNTGAVLVNRHSHPAGAPNQKCEPTSGMVVQRPDTNSGYGRRFPVYNPTPIVQGKPAVTGTIKQEMPVISKSGGDGDLVKKQSLDNPVPVADSKEAVNSNVSGIQNLTSLLIMENVIRLLDTVTKYRPQLQPAEGMPAMTTQMAAAPVSCKDGQSLPDCKSENVLGVALSRPVNGTSICSPNALSIKKEDSVSTTTTSDSSLSSANTASDINAPYSPEMPAYTPSSPSSSDSDDCAIVDKNGDPIITPDSDIARPQLQDVDDRNHDASGAVCESKPSFRPYSPSSTLDSSNTYRPLSPKAMKTTGGHSPAIAEGVTPCLNILKRPIVSTVDSYPSSAGHGSSTDQISGASFRPVHRPQSTSSSSLSPQLSSEPRDQSSSLKRNRPWQSPIRFPTPPTPIPKFIRTQLTFQTDNELALPKSRRLDPAPLYRRFCIEQPENSHSFQEPMSESSRPSPTRYQTTTITTPNTKIVYSEPNFVPSSKPNSASHSNSTASSSQSKSSRPRESPSRQNNVNLSPPPTSSPRVSATTTTTTHSSSSPYSGSHYGVTHEPTNELYCPTFNPTADSSYSSSSFRPTYNPSNKSSQPCYNPVPPFNFDYSPAFGLPEPVSYSHAASYGGPFQLKQNPTSGQRHSDRGQQHRPDPTLHDQRPRRALLPLPPAFSDTSVGAPPLSDGDYRIPYAPAPIQPYDLSTLQQPYGALYGNGYLQQQFPYDTQPCYNPSFRDYPLEGRQSIASRPPAEFHDVDYRFGGGATRNNNY